MITSLYASLLAVLFFRISIDTIKARRSQKISLGTGKNDEIASIVSAHHNFASFVPVLLFMTFLVEHSGRIPDAAIHLVAGAYTAGRYLHYLAFSGEKMNFKQRVLGMQMTLFPLLILAGMNFYIYICRYVSP